MRMKQPLELFTTLPVKPVTAVQHGKQHNHGDRSQYYLGSWITARRSGSCVKCGGTIMQGDTVKYIPAHKRTLCRQCGNADGQAVMGFIRGVVV